MEAPASHHTPPLQLPCDRVLLRSRRHPRVRPQRAPRQSQQAWARVRCWRQWVGVGIQRPRRPPLLRRLVGDAHLFGIVAQPQAERMPQKSLKCSKDDLCIGPLHFQWTRPGEWSLASGSENCSTLPVSEDVYLAPSARHVARNDTRASGNGASNVSHLPVAGWRNSRWAAWRNWRGGSGRWARP